MKCKLMVFAVLFCVGTSALANEETEKTYLIQVLNQLDALRPLVLSASKEQQINSRIKFHYTAFIGSNGKSHNGLLEDINEIKKGVEARINHIGVEPHRFEVIKGDYVDARKLKLEE